MGKKTTGWILLITSFVMPTFYFIIDLFTLFILTMITIGIDWVLCCSLSLTFFIIGLVFILSESKEVKRQNQNVISVKAQDIRSPQKPISQLSYREQRLKLAQNYEKAEKLENAALIYEELEMWEDAGRVRRKSKGSTIKHVHVNANELFDVIRTQGLAFSYKCPNCGGNMNIDGTSQMHLCPFCGSTLNIEKLSQMVDRMLE